MRQAGRSLPEYRALRGEGSILDAIRQPKLAAEITLQPVRRYGVDAAILYSDIVVPVAAIGFGVDVAPGTGPVVAEPFRTRADLDRLRPLDPEARHALRARDGRRLVERAARRRPLIGFAGAPFTVASYLVEGRPSRTYAATKAMMLGDPELWDALATGSPTWPIASLAIAGRSRRSRGAAVRQLGGRAGPARSTSATCCRPSRKVFDGRRRSRRPADPLRREHRRAARADARGRRRRRRRRLANAVSAMRAITPGRRRARSRATSILRVCFAPWPCVDGEVRRGARRTTTVTLVTSSISATASCPTPIPTCSNESSNSSTQRAGSLDDRRRRDGVRHAGVH